MPAVLNAAYQRIKLFWSGITVSQRLLVAGLAVGAVAVFIGLIVWMNRPEFSTLYSNLGPEDAGRVVKALDARKIPFRLEQNGTAVLVPADKVYEMRISLAGENILTGQGVGFEIFDQVNVGVTDFVQKLNYRRALEGELARTISEFPAVESARIHLVVPNRSLFLEDQQQPSASVLLKLSGSRKMEPRDVEAIVNLVTMSVEGLDKSRVSVADTSGKVLFQPEEEGSLDGLTRTQLDFKNRTQQTLERRIEELLMPVVGAGRVIARVNADMDFSRKTINKVLWDPDKTVLRSEHRSEESQQGNARLDSGVADPNFRGDGLTGNNSSQAGSRETRQSNFEINREEQSIISNIGDIDRLSVAVIVDGTYTAGEDGSQTFVPRSEEELRRIRQLVSNAVGFNSARGDTIEVSNIPFSGIDIPKPEAIAAIIADYALRFGKPLLNALLVFLFLILVVRPVILALIRPKVEGRMVEELEGLPQSDGRLALAEEDSDLAADTAILEKIEDIKAHALQLSEQNMDQALGIIKSWLKDSPASGSQLPAKAA
ncbi:MAG: flagellar M-ring protein FliF [Desulfovibrio sp.]|jgi:flagellar M-ring protein FliF|nr:flagellar M-ring protein FliF [Desulfovibrio sp.]